MKRKCKHIDITNPDIIREWVTDCIRRHKKRYDFRDMLFRYGMSQKDYDTCIEEHNNSLLLPTVEKIITEVCRQLRERSLELKPNFAIQPLGQIDMMGYVIYRKGTVSIRARNYIKARRLKLRYKGRGTLSLRQAKRLTSYKGFFVHSGYNKGGMSEAFRTAQKIISIKEKRNGKGNICRTAGKNLLPQAS